MAAQPIIVRRRFLRRETKRPGICGCPAFFVRFFRGVPEFRESRTSFLWAFGEPCATSLLWLPPADPVQPWRFRAGRGVGESCTGRPRRVLHRAASAGVAWGGLGGCCAGRALCGAVTPPCGFRERRRPIAGRRRGSRRCRPASARWADRRPPTSSGWRSLRAGARRRLPR